MRNQKEDEKNSFNIESNLDKHREAVISRKFGEELANLISEDYVKSKGVDKTSIDS